MIRPPTRFKVLGQVHSMKIIRREQRPHWASEHAIGGNDLNGQAAWVQSDLSAYQKMDTYLHEALHAIFYLGGLRTHLGDADEPLINALSPQLLHFLRDNPQVVRYLTQKVDAA